MEYNYSYTFPAVRGIQANRDFFITMCPLKLIPKLFIFNEEELPPEHRAQRILNRSRIPYIVNYITENPTDYVFSSITVSIDGELEFVPISDHDPNIGRLIISMDASFVINDGQHRRAAIEEALKENPQLGNETISVVIFHDQGLINSQQMFADLNKHAINTTKSIGILYDSRDHLSILTKRLIYTIDLLQVLTDKENSSLPKYSPKIFTLSSLYNANKILLGNKKSNRLSTEDIEFIEQYWKILCESISEWNLVKNKLITAADLRLKYLSSHGVVLEAMAVVFNYLWINNYPDWQDYITKLDQINWQRDNVADWQDRAFSTQGKIIKSKTNILLTSAKIKQILSIPLSPDEEKLEQGLISNAEH